MPVWDSMLSVGSRRNSGNEYPDDRTRDGERSTTKTCCDVVVAWSADDSWLTTRAVRTARNVRCTVHMQRVAMTQPRAKNSLTSIWRPSIPAAGLQLDQRIRQHGHGVEVQLTSQLRSEIHRCKRRQQQRNTTENARNQQPRPSLNNDRYIAKQVIVGNQQ